MEVRDWLNRASDNGKKPVRQIVFEGERFDVMSIRRWRDLMLQSLRDSLETQALRDPDANVRLSAIEKLSSHSVDKVVRGILLELLATDPDERIRVLSIKKLVWLLAR